MNDFCSTNPDEIADRDPNAIGCEWDFESNGDGIETYWWKGHRFRVKEYFEKAQLGDQYINKRRPAEIRAATCRGRVSPRYLLLTPQVLSPEGVWIDAPDRIREDRTANKEKYHIVENPKKCPKCEKIFQPRHGHLCGEYTTESRLSWADPAPPRNKPEAIVTFSEMWGEEFEL